jgi:hypothetical protein
MQLLSKLETIALLSSAPQNYGPIYILPEQSDSLELPNLRNMTLALGNRMRSDLRIRAPHLTSLHIQIDNTADAEVIARTPF